MSGDPLSAPLNEKVKTLNIFYAVGGAHYDTPVMAENSFKKIMWGLVAGYENTHRSLAYPEPCNPMELPTLIYKMT